MAGRGGPILIVDDDASLRSYLRELLARAGYETVEAATGDDALAAAEQQPLGAVLLDVHMPGMSEYAVCRELRERTARSCRSSSSRELARSRTTASPASSLAQTTTS
jgi:CheY-like chemotaxis protein